MRLEENAKKIIIANLLKKECNDALLSQQVIVKETEKSKQYVSSIFTGNGAINKKFVDQVLMMACGQKFNFNDDFQNTISQLLSDYLVEYAHMSDGDIGREVDSYLNEQTYFSYACPEFLALKCARLYKNNELKKLERMVSMIELNFIDAIKSRDEVYLLFLMIKSEYQTDTDQWSSALKTLKEAKEYVSSSCILGVIHLYEGLAHYQLHNNVDALFSFQQAEYELKRTSNYRRSLAVAKNIGSCLSQMQQFERAEQQFLDVIETARRMNRYDVMDACNSSLSYIYFQKGQFSKAIDAGRKVRESYSKKGHYIHLAWSYYYLKDYTKCRKYTRMMERESNDPYYTMMAELLDLYLNKANSNQKINLLKAMYDFCVRNECHGDALWVLKILIDEYKNENDLDNIVICQNYLLELLGYKIYWSVE